MRLSVACNFDDALLDGLGGQPVYEVFGKVTADAMGGGRPSFYLPQADKARVEHFVRRAHAMGIEFNYLIKRPGWATASTRARASAPCARRWTGSAPSAATA